MKRKIMIALLCALGLCLLVCAGALADNVNYLKSDGSQGTANCTPMSAATVELGNGWYAVQSSITFNEYQTIVVNGDTNLVLCNGATLNAPAGIFVQTGKSLTIWAQSNVAGTMGRINAQGIDGGNSVYEVHYAAGIGGMTVGIEDENVPGWYDYTCHDFGSITINGGRITATGGKGCAGIGGADDSGRPSNASNGTVTIKGGIVEATGGSDAAGIGNGYAGCFKAITINGGTVSASAHLKNAWSGAAIGGSAGSGSVTITGGEVHAAGTNTGCYDIRTRSLAVSGGKVYCEGDEPINVKSAFNITSGEIHAAGVYGEGCQATVTGGEIYVTGGIRVFDGADTEGVMTVTGGKIYADNGGIQLGSGAALNITGGEIHAANAGISIDSEALMTVTGGVIDVHGSGIYGDETYTDESFWGKTILTWQPASGGTVPAQPRILAGGFSGIVTLGNRFSGGDAVFMPTDRADAALLAGKTLVPTAMYGVRVEGAAHGTVSASPLYGNPGTTITVSLAADTGYVPAAVTWTPTGGQPVAIQPQQGVYAFALPESDVTVNARFKPEPISYYDPAAGTNRTCADFTWLHDLADPTALTAGWYAVKSTATVSGRIHVSGSVNLILCDDVYLKASSGINVTGTDRLTIWAQSSGDHKGRLDAKGIEDSAGIGGGDEQSGGYITINGGEIVASGGSSGAGIGGGARSLSASCDGGHITINSGEISAYGGITGAGIGGGYRGDGGTIVIGGDARIAFAYGGIGGAGIGGGDMGSGGNITIGGSAVIDEAVGLGDSTGLGSAGIGGGSQGAGGNITITGGTISCAQGGTNGAGIGGGAGCSGGNITISGGNIIAFGDNFEGGRLGGGAGIGGGGEADAGTIRITGGTVEAQGGAYAAGIGGGKYSSNYNGTIVITGGTITARGGAGGTGGSAYGNYGSGAGIGGGLMGSAGSIRITGGNITARGGAQAVGIGHGAMSDGGGTIRLGWTLTAEGHAPAWPIVNTEGYDYTAMRPEAPFAAANADGDVVAVVNTSYPEESVIAAFYNSALTLYPIDGYAIHVEDDIDNGGVSAPVYGAPDAEVALIIEPDEGYGLAAGSLSVTSGGQVLEVTMKDQLAFAFTMPAGEVYVTAAFDPAYQVVFENYDGSALQSGYYSDGVTPVYTGQTPRRDSADSHEAYAFSGWEPEIAPVDGAPVTYTAQYSVEQYHLMRFMVSYDDGATWSIARIDRVPADSQTFTITDWEPWRNGYRFAGWQSVDGETVYHPGDTVEGVSDDLEFSALWVVADPDDPPKPEPADDVYIEGNGVVQKLGNTYTAIPDPGNRFVCWRGSTSYRHPEPYLLSESPVLELWSDVYNLGAYFEGSQPHTVLVKSEGHGTAEASHESCTMDTLVTLTVTPDTGYRLARWEVIYGGARIVGNRFFMPNADVSLKAVFEVDPRYHTITVADDIEHGSITAPYAATEGDAVSVTFQPDPKYALDASSLAVMCGDEAVPYTLEGGICTFTMPAGDVTITAGFEARIVPYLAVNAAGEAEERLCAQFELMTGETVVWGENNATTWYVADGAVNIAGRVSVRGAVSLILTDGAALHVPQGITVSSGSSLTIYAQSAGAAMGALTVDAAAESCAGIGGAKDVACGDIIIAGGRITARGSGATQGGTGIGGGGMRMGGGSVTILGGNVTASANRFAAAIGGGYQGTSTSVTIRGGVVRAEVSSNGAGIGSGQMGATAYNICDISVNISGGEVTVVKSGGSGAGIGGGYGTAGGALNIAITGGRVTVSGGSLGDSRANVTLDWPATVTAGSYAGSITLQKPFRCTETGGARTVLDAGTLTGGIPAGATLKPNLPEIHLEAANGTIKAFDEQGSEIDSAAPGQTVCLSAVPDEDYTLVDISLRCGDETESLAVSGGEASFIMGEGDVTVIATFVEAFDMPGFILPAGTKIIGESAFEGDRAIAAVEIPTGCTTIKDYAFRNCTNLTKVRIPESVNQIGEHAFDGCTLVYIYAPATSAAEVYARAHTNCVFVEDTTD